MSTMKHPNIILILTDQQSSSMMGCAGNTFVRTPNMDRLAASGIRFTRAYCTNPVCVPSRVSLLTGRMPGEFHGNHNEAAWQVNPAEQNIAMGNLVKNAGYEVVYGGKVHVPDPLHPRCTGYDYFCDDERGELAKRCAEFIGKPHDRPFFMVASFINPHDICYHAIRNFPVTATENLLNRANAELAALDQALQLPEGVSEEEFWRTHCPPLPSNHEVQEHEPEAIADMVKFRAFKAHARDKWQEKDWRMHRWAYARLTEMVDAEIGAVLDAVDQAGIGSDTVIVFTSDHGDHDASHKLEHKTAFYEEAAKIPLLISYPGKIPAGIVDHSHLISNGLDILPTICDYAGAEVPSELKGSSIRAICEGHSPENWRSDLYMECQFGFAVVGREYKYAFYNNGQGRNNEQLYDLSRDPHETKHAGTDPEKHSLLKCFRERLTAHQQLHYGGSRSVQDFQ